MKTLFALFLASLLLGSCSKNTGARIDIYLLEDFQIKMDTTRNPGTIQIVNPVLSRTPLVPDGAIESYVAGAYTFTLRLDIRDQLSKLQADKAFAVCVDEEIIYLGKIHPSYLSSISFGVATIDPILYRDKQLRIDYAFYLGAPVDLKGLDKRNDTRLLNALSASNRLR